MSVIEIPQRRLINPDSYQQSLAAAKGLDQKEILPLNQRRRLVSDLLSLVRSGDPNDSEAEDEAVELSRRLLLSDPLTDQQAGAVARCLLFIRRHDIWPLDLGESHRHYHLNLEEVVEILAGDWESINRIFTRFQQRSLPWQKSLGQIEISTKPVTVYRMLELHPDDVPTIRQSGMVPEGLHRYLDIKSVIAAQLHPQFGQGYLPENLYLSKANLLIESWTAPVGVHHLKLSLATSTAENIRHRGLSFFRSHIFEIVLPANRLIAAPTLDLPENERVILNFIEPEAIKAVYEMEPISPYDLWEQITRKRLASLPLIGRLGCF